MRIGLFFGSFNPIHIGHMCIANYMLEFTDLEEIWFVVSPQNPWKNNQELLAQQERVNMVALALADEQGYKVSDFEKDLDKPSYTYQSLKYIQTLHPNNSFVLIIGGDNCDAFNAWKNSNKILEMVDIYAYPRSGDEQAPAPIQLVDAPLIDISSTEIRKWIKEKRNIPYMVSPQVHNYIKLHNLYTSSYE